VQITIIIPTWNNAQRLDITLSAMARCERASIDCEFIVVSTPCGDRTDEIVKAWEPRLPLRHLHEHRMGLARARNTGLEAARGELVIFTDDDVKPCANWLNLYWQAFETRPQGYYFGGSIDSDYESGPPHPDLMGVAPPSIKGLHFGNQARTLDDGECFVSANWACRANELRSVGGFDEALGLHAVENQVVVGEETDLQMRLQGKGLRAWYLPDAPVAHFVPRDKSTLRHIADRYQASAEIWQRRRLKADGETSCSKAPRWLRRKQSKLWWRWLTCRLLRRNGYREYLSYRWTLGRVQGYVSAAHRQGLPEQKHPTETSQHVMTNGD
jgi:glycosyltransferase involved in cell wall biosynthesis